MLLPVALPDGTAPGVTSSSLMARRDGTGHEVEQPALHPADVDCMCDSLKLTRWASVCSVPKKVMA